MWKLRYDFEVCVVGMRENFFIPFSRAQHVCAIVFLHKNQRIDFCDLKNQSVWIQNLENFKNVEKNKIWSFSMGSESQFHNEGFFLLLRMVSTHRSRYIYTYILVYLKSPRSIAIEVYIARINGERWNYTVLVNVSRGRSVYAGSEGVRSKSGKHVREAVLHVIFLVGFLLPGRLVLSRASLSSSRVFPSTVCSSK